MVRSPSDEALKRTNASGAAARGPSGSTRRGDFSHRGSTPSLTRASRSAHVAIIFLRLAIAVFVFSQMHCSAACCDSIERAPGFQAVVAPAFVLTKVLSRAAPWCLIGGGGRR
jgi:hypothetical protein